MFPVHGMILHSGSLAKHRQQDLHIETCSVREEQIEERRRWEIGTGREGRERKRERKDLCECNKPAHGRVTDKIGWVEIGRGFKPNEKLSRLSDNYMR
jgi:hypothetical protein